MEISAGIFIINTDNTILIGHPTNGSWTKNWSIPKGKLEDNEDTIDAAIRETYEECNYNLSEFKNNLIDIGYGKYKRKGKILFAYVFKSKTFIWRFDFISVF